MHLPQASPSRAKLTSSLTEARKQAQAEADYYQWCEEQDEELRQQFEEEVNKRHDSKISANTSQRPSTARQSQSLSQFDDFYEPIAENVAKRRGSDDSIKTAYAADEQVPDSAFRNHPDLTPDVSAEQPQQLTVVVPETLAVNEDIPISPFTTD